MKNFACVVTKKQTENSVLIGIKSNPLNTGYDSFGFVSLKGLKSLIGEIKAGKTFNVEAAGLKLDALKNAEGEELKYSDGSPVVKASFL